MSVWPSFRVKFVAGKMPDLNSTLVAFATHIGKQQQKIDDRQILRHSVCLYRTKSFMALILHLPNLAATFVKRK